MTPPLPNIDSPDSAPARNGAYLTCEFSDNTLVQQLVGPHNANLSRLEQRLGVVLHNRGNTVAIEGPPDKAALAENALSRLYDRLSGGLPIEEGDVDAAARMAAPDESHANMDLSIRTRKRHISPRTKGQAGYLHALNTNELVFALGPAGTGKTYLAVAKAVAMKLAGQVDRIVLSRPAVEAGERLGFLPGDMREKVDPYLRPLYDARPVAHCGPQDQSLRFQPVSDAATGPCVETPFRWLRPAAGEAVPRPSYRHGGLQRGFHLLWVRSND